MPLTDFYVQPASMLTGLGAISQGVEAMIQKEERQKEQAMTSGLMDVMQSQNPDLVFDFISENPEAINIADKMAGFVSDITKQDKVATAKRILAGESPAEAMTEHAETITREGGDPTQTIETARQSAADPEYGRRQAKIMLALYDPEAYRSLMTAEAPTTIEEPKVGAQEILEDGTIIQSTAKGPVVYDPTGEKVTGQAAADAVKRARAEKVSNLRLAAGGKKRATLEAEEELKAKVEAGVVSAKAAATASVSAFNRLEKINTSINNIDEAIRLVDEGAATGAIYGRLPSIRAASVKLDNLQGRLGLDVVGNTTFGALSEAELKFALDVALPKKLKGPELKNWLIEKKNAQEKLADYVEAAAIFLGTPGNTMKGWIERQREKRTEIPADGEETREAAGIASEAPTITNQGQYDILPSGSTFYEDGKLYRKP